MSIKPICAALAILMFGAAAHAAPRNAAKMDARARVALARLQAGESAQSLRARAAAVTPEGDLNVFIRGDVSRAELEAAGARVRTATPSGIFTASVPVSAVERVLALSGVRGMGGSAPVELELNASVATTGVNVLRGASPGFAGGLNGDGIVIGDVDTGVDYGHGDFTDAMGNSRILAVWDQSDDVTGPAPPGYGYGTEWTNAQLTAGTSTQKDLDGHGTHVLSIAGGDGSQTGGAIPAYTYTGMAPLADLVMVKTSFSTTDIVDGVAYVFDQAAPGQPAVCNLSLGSQFGPHDGTSLWESALASLTDAGRIIIKSAGNDRGTGRHAEVLAPAAPTSATLLVSNSGDGRYFDIDGYYESTDNLSVRVTTPNGTTLGPITIGNANAASPPGTFTANGSVYFENGVFTTASGDREVFLTVEVEAGQNANGTWTITFIPVAVGAGMGHVDLWRYSTSAGNLSSNFVTGVQDEELLSEPGNSDSLITVAAYVSKSVWTSCAGIGSTYSAEPPVGNLASYSSPGPTRDGRQKPDIAAPGVAIGAARSLDIILGCPAGASVYLNDGMIHRINSGTSMAAPHAAGMAALLMQHYGMLYPSQIKQLLTTHATVDGFTGAVWNKNWGRGKLHLNDILVPAAAVTAPNGGQNLAVGSGTTLTWTASDIPGVTTVDLQLSRNGPDGPFENIAMGIANSGSRAWTVTGPGTGEAYLKVTARDAALNTTSDMSNAAFDIYSATLGVGDGPAGEFALRRVAPSPTVGPAQVEFALAYAANVRLSVFDVQGREVAVLASGRFEAGDHKVSWDGRAGRKPAGAGLYFVRFATPERWFVQRLVVAH